MIQGKFEAKKDGLRQTQDGQWKLTFTVHPEEFPAELAQADMGTRYMVAYAEIGDDEQPVVKPGTPKPDKTDGQRAVQRAGILANDTDFYYWADEPADPADYIRTYCGVQSRADLANDHDALQKFLDMEMAFKQAIGRTAEER